MPIIFWLVFALAATVLASLGGAAGYKMRPWTAPRTERDSRSGFAAIAWRGWRPETFRRILFGAGIVSAVLLAWMVLYGGLRPVSVAALLTLVMAPALLLYPKYEPRLGRVSGRIVAGFLDIWVVVIAVSALVIVVYSALNFPREGPFQEKLVVRVGPQAEQDAWKRLTEMGLAPEGTYDAEDYIDLIAQGPFSMPEQQRLSLETPFPNLGSLIGLGESGREEVAELIAEGRPDEAYEKYLLLWSVADNMIGGEGSITLIQYLIGVDLGYALADFHLEDDNSARLPGDERLSEIVERYERRLAGAFERAISGEYGWGKEIAEHPEDWCRFGGLGSEDSATWVCPFHLPWPFYDANKTLRVRHDLFFEMVELNRAAMHQSRSDSVDLDERFERASAFSLWKNPVGSLVNAATLPFLSRFAHRDHELKAKLTILAYLVRATESGRLGSPPTNPLTGTPFVVTDKGDRIEIRSAHRGDGIEPRLWYDGPKVAP